MANVFASEPDDSPENQVRYQVYIVKTSYRIYAVDALLVTDNAQSMRVKVGLGIPSNTVGIVQRTTNLRQTAWQNGELPSNRVISPNRFATQRFSGVDSQNHRPYQTWHVQRSISSLCLVGDASTNFFLRKQLLQLRSLSLYKVAFYRLER